MKTIKSIIMWLTIFGIAMGFLESAIVIYLRKIYYPEGFRFPLFEIGNDILSVEILREVATMIMLLAIGFLAGKTKLQRFSYFIFSFAIWDIFYYIFLKIFLDWPESLMTADILFLIPAPWVGPVIAPIILSFSMIVLSVVLLHCEEYRSSETLKSKDWKLLITGSTMVIFSFLFNFIKSLEGMIASSPIEVIQPDFGSINWIIFLLGEIIIVFEIFRIFRNHHMLTMAAKKIVS